MTAIKNSTSIVSSPSPIRPCRSCWCTDRMPGWCASVSMPLCARPSTIRTIRSRSCASRARSFRQSVAAGGGGQYDSVVRRPARGAAARYPRYNAAPALTPLIEAPSPDCRVIIEAGELRKTAPLRTMCEKAKTAAALPCYLDDAKAISSLIDEEMRAAKLTLTPDARAALTSLLGGDRLASRGELRKLAVYAMGRERIELDDVMAVVADASEQALDGVIDAAFAGRHRRGRNRIRQGARRRLLARGHRLRGDPPGRQSAQDEAGGGRRQLDRVRHDARRAAGAFQRARKPVGAALRAWSPATAAARHGAARRGLAGGAAQRRRWPRPSRSARCCRSRRARGREN